MLKKMLTWSSKVKAAVQYRRGPLSKTNQMLFLCKQTSDGMVNQGVISFG